MKAKNTKVSLCRSDKIYYFVSYAIIVLLTLIVLYPLIYIVSASFSSAAAVNAGRVWFWPVDFSTYSYEYLLSYKTVWMGFGNTIFYTVVGTAINIFVTILAAYPLARKDMVGRGTIMFLFTFTMLFNAGMIPNYINLRTLGMLNTRWALLLPGAISVYNMIVMRTFIQNSIPNELLEASKLDGCSDIKYLIHVVLPLSKAVLAVVTMYYAVSHWNSYFSAFLYLSDRKLYPLQIFLRQILVNSTFDTADITDPDMLAQIQGLTELLKYSIIVVATAPLLCVYPFVQKYFEKGVMIGSVKG